MKIMLIWNLDQRPPKRRTLSTAILFLGALIVSAILRVQAERCLSYDDFKNDRWGYIDKTGTCKINAQFVTAKDFHCARAFVTEVNSFWGIEGFKLIDEGGHQINNNLYFRVHDFHDGFAKASVIEEIVDRRIHLLNQLIDRNGTPKYSLKDEIATYQGESVFVCNWKKSVLLRNSGFDVTPLYVQEIYDEKNGGPIPFVKNGKKGYMNELGQFVISPQFAYEQTFSEGIALAASNRPRIDPPMWGFIDPKGAWLVKPRYKWYHRFSEGLCWVEEGPWKGFVNKSGEKVLSTNEYSMVGDFHEGLARFRRHGEGFLDKEGMTRIPDRFQTVADFSEGLAPACVEVEGVSKWGFIDKTGRWIISPQFKKARSFSDGLAAVLVNN